MPFGIARLGDSDSKGASQVVGSPNVLCENLPVCRTGDVDTGTSEDPPGAAIGLSTVFVNNVPIYTVGEPDSQGRSLVVGSFTVFAKP